MVYKIDRQMTLFAYCLKLNNHSYMVVNTVGCYIYIYDRIT